jgi:kynureninase
VDWGKWRDEFPILSRKTYLNSCSLGALSHRAEGRIRQFHEDWHNYGASAWYEIWLGRLAELRGRVSRMLGAQEHELAVTHSTSTALSSIASAIDYGKRNKVVVAELDFPTLPYQWLVRPDVEVVYARSDDGATVLSVLPSWSMSGRHLSLRVTSFMRRAQFRICARSAISRTGMARCSW